MPSNKRQRQRAQRQAKLEYEARLKKRRRTARQLTIGGIIVALVLALLIFSQMGSNSKKVASKSSTTTAPKTTTSSKSTIGPSSTTSSPTPTSSIPAGSTGAVPASDACPASIANVARKTTFPSAPAMLINTSSTYYANFQTDVGNIKIKLEPNLSPITVNSFVFLACYHYYDGTIFHRVIPNFMDQGGDPNGNPPGTGGPGYTIPDEYPTGSTNTTPYAPGQLAMANTGTAHSGGSQFFIVASQSGAKTLDQDISSPGAEDYTIFGQVVQGMNVVLKINNDGTQSGTPKVTHHLEKVTITSS